MTRTPARPHLRRRTSRHLATAVCVLVAGLTSACTASSPQATDVAAPTPPSVTSRAAVPVPAPTTLAPSRPPSSTSPTRTTVPAAPAHAQPVAVPIGSDRGGVPWGEVGPGWVVVLASTVPDGEDHDNRGPFTLDLVSPGATRYRVGTVPVYARLQDVTADGRRVVGVVGTGDGSRLVEWDLAARTSRTLAPAPFEPSSVTWTRPTGQQLLVSGFDGSAYRTVRMTRTGHVEATYRTGGMPPVSTADGTALVTTAPSGDALQVLDNATGAVRRTVATPAGYEHCWPSRSWGGADVSVVCGLRGRSSLDVLVVSTATGAYRAVTHTDVADPSEMFGYVSAWPLGSGVVAQRATGCGPGPVGLLTGAGRIGTELSWPGAEYPPAVLGVAAGRVYAEVTTCGDTPSTVLSQDPLTHRTTTLATGSSVQALLLGDR